MVPRARVLIVDDDPMILKLVSRAVTDAGHEVANASDGAAAIELLREGTFDAVVSDISMPGMSGLQLLRAVRERDLDVPVVLMTGDPSLETAIEALDHGALRYLQKPFDGKVLSQTVEHAIKLGRMARLKRQALELAGAGGLGLGDRTSLTTAFERALGQIWMAYQPIVRWSERRVFAYEALVRTDEATLATPSLLLDAAERLGRVHDLGRAARRCVAETIERSPAPDGTCFVNLHPRDLLDADLYDPAAPLTAHASRVVLEITERVSLDEVSDVRARVASLRRLGYRVALDDLGAGYAGLGAFALLEPEVVKIDMFLVRDIDADATKRRLVRSIAELCADLGLVVICEGVETAAERDAVVALGCDRIQGYLFAHPARQFPPALF